MFVLILSTGFIITLALTALVRHYAQHRQLLDYPNVRSSHSVPTPRGGGIAIAAVVLLGVVLLAATNQLPLNIALALGGGGAAVAAVGFVDDRRSLHPLPRLTVQIIAALWAVYWLGGLPHFRLGSNVVVLWSVGYVIAVLGIVWLTNLYNFMDGIDGLAAGQAVLVGAFAGSLLAFWGESPLAALTFLVCGSAAGFLAWNWQPARIFMGDVGSGLLGFLFGGIALASENTDAVPAVVFVFVLGTFIFDATVTLVRRIVRSENWYTAHRSHAYQRAVQAGWTHSRVTMIMLALGALIGFISWLGIVIPSLFVTAAAVALALLIIAYAAVERARPMQ